MEEVEEKQNPLPVKQKKELFPYEKENLSALEKAVIGLSEELSNVTELREAIDYSFKNKNEADNQFQTHITTCFNTIIERFDEINKKFTQEIDYNRELDLKIKNNEFQGQIYLLEKQLNKEREQITFTIDNINSMVKDNLAVINEKCSNLKDVDETVKKTILDFRTDTFEASENEYKALRIKCEKALETFTENSQKTLETLQKVSIDFLKQCDKKNKEIIEKIPQVKGKLTAESWTIIIFSCIGFAGLLYNIFF